MRACALLLSIHLLFSGCGGNGKEADAVIFASDTLSAHYLGVAVKTANWLKATAITTPSGIEWRANPEDTASVYYSLYYGSPGILIFFLEMYHVTDDTSYLRLAERAADNLMAVTADARSKFFAQQRTGFTGPENQRAGLYSGLAGIGFALEEVYKASSEKKYHYGMLHCVQVLKDSAKVKDDMASWSATEDLLCGDAGTGLFLLYAFEHTKDASLLKLAAQTGNELVKKGIPDGSGLKWPMAPCFPRLMPNFAHGTSGVSYFLLKLYEETGSKDFLAAGEKGAYLLKQIAEKNNGLVFHHEGDGVYKGKCGGPACIAIDSCMGKNLFYLSWCHGPAGTGRLFFEMEKITKDPEWASLAKKGAEAAIGSGIPEKLTDGYWNNLGQCCGAAGLGDYLLTLHRRGNDYLDFAHHLARFLEKSAVIEGNGLKFPHAENNRERNVVYAQTGYMTGAAGIGMYFLHLHELEKNLTPIIKFPDDSF